MTLGVDTFRAWRGSGAPRLRMSSTEVEPRPGSRASAVFVFAAVIGARVLVAKVLPCAGDRSKAVGEPPLMLGIAVYSPILDAVHAVKPGGQPKLEAPARRSRSCARSSRSEGDPHLPSRDNAQLRGVARLPFSIHFDCGWDVDVNRAEAGACHAAGTDHPTRSSGCLRIRLGEDEPEVPFARSAVNDPNMHQVAVGCMRHADVLAVVDD